MFQTRARVPLQRWMNRAIRLPRSPLYLAARLGEPLGHRGQSHNARAWASFGPLSGLFSSGMRVISVRDLPRHFGDVPTFKR
jgi:hypothetical protein